MLAVCWGVGVFVFARQAEVDPLSSAQNETCPVRWFMRQTANPLLPEELSPYGPFRCASAIGKFMPSRMPARASAAPMATVFGVMSFPFPVGQVMDSLTGVASGDVRIRHSTGPTVSYSPLIWISSSTDMAKPSIPGNRELAVMFMLRSFRRKVLF